MADSGFFQLFRYDFVEGSPGTAINGPYAMVLSKEIADKLFDGQLALGKVVHVSSGFNGDHDYTVTGVFKPINMPSHIDARFFLSMYGGAVGDFMRKYTNMASNIFFYTYIRLKPGTDPAALERQFPQFIKTYEGKDLKEIGIRKVLGASTGRLVALLSVDFLKLVMMAIILGMPLGWWAAQKWLGNFAFRTTIPWWVFAFSAAAALLIAFGTISFQAIRAARSNPVDSLRNQ